MLMVYNSVALIIFLDGEDADCCAGKEKSDLFP